MTRQARQIGRQAGRKVDTQTSRTGGTSGATRNLFCEHFVGFVWYVHSLMSYKGFMCNKNFATQSQGGFDSRSVEHEGTCFIHKIDKIRG